MDLSFKSILSQSNATLKSHIKEILVLTVINTGFVFLFSKLSYFIEQIKNVPTALWAFFVALSPIFITILFLLLPIIILNKESGQNASYQKMIHYIITRFVPLMGTNILYGLIVLGGYLLFIVPGLVWYYSYGQASFFSLIDGTGPIQSLKLSRIATKKSKRKLFNLIALIGLIYGIPLALIGLLLTLFKMQEFLILNMCIETFATYLFSITSYIIWKTLRQNMISNK